MRAINPSAHVGVLGNEYVDYQAAADYVLKEVVHWDTWDDDPRCRAVDYQTMGTALGSPAFHDLYQFYAPLRVLGIKGNEPDEINALHALPGAT